jgi:hypothetical protein
MGVRRVILSITIVAPLIALVIWDVGVEHQVGRATQRCGEFEAQCEIDRWYLFGQELSVYDRMAVFPAEAREQIESGQNLLIQRRVLGRPAGPQDDLFGLGDDGRRPESYDSSRTIRYILETKRDSAVPKDRIWFIEELWTEQYPGQRKDVRTLLGDPDARVRAAAKQKLDSLAE